MRRNGEIVALAALLALASPGCKTLLDNMDEAGQCGDGIVQPEMGEECDPAQPDSSKCSSLCKRQKCGNKVLDPGEACDHGEGNDDRGDCTRSCARPACGDGHLHDRGSAPFEVCDDGNLVNGDGCNHACTLRGRVTVIAGKPGGRGFADGVGPAARLGGATGLAADSQHAYFSDSGNCVIRRLTLATGKVETLIGVPGNCPDTIQNGPFSQTTLSSNPKHLVLAGQQLYYAQQASLYRADLSAATPSTWLCATLNEPQAGITALAHDPADPSALYAAGAAGVHRVLLPCSCGGGGTLAPCKLGPIAGSVKLTKTSNDGIGAAAAFTYITGLSYDHARGALYASDIGRVRQIVPTTRAVTTIAGGALLGHKDGSGSSARFFPLQGITHHPTTGDLFVVQHSGELDDSGATAFFSPGWGTVRRLRRLGAGPPVAWTVDTLAGIHGSVKQGATGESDGFGTYARLLGPRSIARHGETLLVAEAGSIRAVSISSGAVATAAGRLVQDFTLYEPRSITAAGDALYVPAFGGDLLELPVGSSRPRRRIALCTNKKTIAQRVVYALAAKGKRLFAFDLSLPGICQVDLSGKETSKIVWQWKPSAAEQYNDWIPTGMAYDEAKGVFYVVDRNWDRILRLKYGGTTASEVKIGVPLQDPHGLALEGGYLYLADRAANQLLRIDPDSGAALPWADGLARTRDGARGKASICHPTAVASDGTSLFVAESYCPPLAQTQSFVGNAIRQIDLSSGRVTTLVGPGPRAEVIEGLGGNASINRASAMVFHPGTKALYAADLWDNVVIKVD